MVEIRVYYEDTDPAGIVYHANYLRYMERARTEYLRERGIEVAEWAKKGLFFLVVSAELKYRAPAYYNDLLAVEVEVGALSRATLTFIHRIRRKAEEELLCEGTIVLVCAGSDLKVRAVPQPLRSLFIRTV